MKTIYSKIMKFAAPVLCVAALASCSDDFLKPDPLSEFEPGKTFSTESGLQAAMAMVDRHLRRNWIDMGGNTNSMGMLSDLHFSDLGVYAKTDALPGRCDYAGNLQANSWMDTGNNAGGELGWMWNDMFDHVKYANTVLTYVDGVEGLDEATKNEYKGRALFHRAWGYYNLTFWFGNLPLVTALPSGPKQDYRSTPMLEILKMLCADLKNAVEWVPAQADMTYYGMINKESCRLLYIKCLLATGDYKEAEKQADILIDQSGLSLMKEPFGTKVSGGNEETWPITRNVIWDLHRGENKMLAANKEYILGSANLSEQSFQKLLWIRYLGPSAYGQSTITCPDGTATGIQRYTLQGQPDKYDATTDWYKTTGRGIGICRPTYWSQHGLWVMDGEEDYQDLRHNPEVGNWIRMEDMTYNNPSSQFHGKKMQLYAEEEFKNGRGKVIVEKGQILCADTIRCWYDIPYYKLFFHDVVSEASDNPGDFQGASLGANANIYIYRLAEAYLLRAEAKLYQGRAAEAAKDVNEIRKRANAKKMYTTVNIGDIMNERARELYLEEFRKVELTRVSMILAMTGIPDEWGNTYDINTWDKQSGTELEGGSYWYQRLMHYSFYNHGTVISGGKELNYRMDKHNLFWPIPNFAQLGNANHALQQNYGYNDYVPNVEMWSTWQEADADCRQ